MNSRMLGIVEWFRDSAISGWAVSANSDTEIIIKRGQDVVAHGTANIERVDIAKGMPNCRGFQIRVPEGFGPSNLSDGSVTVSLLHDGELHLLPLWAPLQAAGLFSSIDFEKLRIGWQSVPVACRAAAIDSLTEASGGLGFGRSSIDGKVQMGRNGIAFLASGSNQLAALYAGRVQIDVPAWIELLHTRSNVLAARSIQFLQIFIPEKTSVLPEYSPYPATPGCAQYHEIVSSSRDAGIPILDGLNTLSKGNRASYFPAGDSHLTTGASELLVRAILTKIGQSCVYDTSPLQSTLLLGDLLAKFPSDGDLRELNFRYPSLLIEDEELVPVLLHTFTPDAGHLGNRRVWSCERAPVPMRVVCFGNSFFERGGSSARLSWWFARLFREFHFVWSPEMSLQYVDEVKPDLVVCQTIERFLTRVPKT